MHDRIRKLAPRTVQLHGELSRRLSAMAARVENVGRCGAGLAPHEVDLLGQSIRDLVRSARALEKEQGGPIVNEDVPPAFEILHRAEQTIVDARSALRDRLHERQTDPAGTIRAALLTGMSLLREADAIVSGERRTRGAA